MIGRLDIVRAAFATVLIPPAVALEVRTFPLPGWLEVLPLPNPALSFDVHHTLGAGEREALILAAHIKPDFVILDDQAARIAANAAEFKVIGAVGLLLHAKRLGLISSVRDELDALRAASFHISPRLYRLILNDAGEAIAG
jgi:predicted nucleic acid-binding protein